MAEEKLGRFGHHPNPADDFCVEVDIIEGLAFDVVHGIWGDPHGIRGRISRAMEFVVGGDQIAIAAKNSLRLIETAIVRPVPSTVALTPDEVDRVAMGVAVQMAEDRIDERGFHFEDYAHVAEILRSDDYSITRAALGNNLNMIIAALDRAALTPSAQYRAGEIAGMERAAQIVEGPEGSLRRRLSGPSTRYAAEISAAIAALPEAAPSDDEWHSIATAPKDGTKIWAAFRADIFPTMRPGRSDLASWNGRQLPIVHPGIGGDGFDMGWTVAAPVGAMGFPDEWIAGWRPLPAPPHVAGDAP